METTTTQLYQLSTTNKDALLFTTEEISYTILGGINTNHLDRMRVTLKIEVLNRKYPDFLNNEELAGIALRATVDLYNDVQVEKLIRRTAERLEIGTSHLYTGIAQLTEQLEKHRLTLIEQSEQKKDKRKILSKEETEKAIDFLKTKHLSINTNHLLGTSGIVGEELNRTIMWYVYTSRKLNRPLHIVSFGSSGTGKSHLQEKVGELIPEEDKIEITTLTQNAFYYFDKDELGHKLILIEDLDGALSSLYPIRELQSKQRISKTVTIKDNKGNTRTIHLKVQGPVTVAGCTTQEMIYEDNANRSFLIYLDESKAQDEKVMHYQRLLSAGKVDVQEEINIKEFLKNVQRVLKPVKIINPFAEYLHIPNEVFKPRRTNAHYLGFIEAVTFYHQYQRQWINSNTGEIIYDPKLNTNGSNPPPSGELEGAVFIQSTIEDIEIANGLIKEILLRKSDELNKATRTYFEYLKAWLKSEEKQSFVLGEARKALNVSHGSQKQYMSILIDNHFIKKEKTKEGFVYTVTSYEDYKQLKQHVETILDNTLQHLKEKFETVSSSVVENNDKKNLTTLNESGSSQAVQTKNEPSKPKPIKAKKENNSSVHPNHDTPPNKNI